MTYSNIGNNAGESGHKMPEDYAHTQPKQQHEEMYNYVQDDELTMHDVTELKATNINSNLETGECDHN